MLDVIIKGGWIADGTGNPAFPGDVAISGDRIVDVGRFPNAEARLVIDASGKTVAPGIIDAHSHTDSTVMLNPTAESTIRQGVTTEIVGNCGNSEAPITLLGLANGAGGFGGAAGAEAQPRTFAEFLADVERLGTSQNLAYYVGHNTLRKTVGALGPDVTPAQFDAMAAALREAMEAGAIGFSTGLEFEPGRSSRTDELTRLNRISAAYGGLHASHIRNRDAAILEAIDEFLSVVRASGCAGQVSHLNVREHTGAPDRAWERSVERIEQARREGLDVLPDFTPLTYGIGQMAGILPQWVRAEGLPRAVEYLRDPATRARLRNDCDRYWRFIHRGEWHRVLMQSNPAFPELNGLTFPEISALWQRDPWDCYFDILAGAGAAMDSVVIVARLFTEEHVAEAVSHPLFILVADGYSTRVDGPLAETTRFPLHYMGMLHFLTYHVRERGTLRMEEAIRKMTSMPATHFGLKDRGLVRRGGFADLMVFDLAKLDDVATIANPVAYCRGVDHVLVNGKAVIAGGDHTGARPGRNLLRA